VETGGDKCLSLDELFTLIYSYLKIHTVVLLEVGSNVLSVLSF